MIIAHPGLDMVCGQWTGDPWSIVPTRNRELLVYPMMLPNFHFLKTLFYFKFYLVLTVNTVAQLLEIDGSDFLIIVQ